MIFELLTNDVKIQNFIQYFPYFTLIRTSSVCFVLFVCLFVCLFVIGRVR